MPRKCCVPHCKSNYKTGESTAVFRFPADPDQAQQWKIAIPRNWKSTNITKNTVVCVKHWPPEFETYKHYGKLRPVNPPSLFPKVKKSCITKVPKKRSTKKALREDRSILPDELNSFSESDKLNFAEILDEYSSRVDGVVGFVEEESKSVILQSTSIDNGMLR